MVYKELLNIICLLKDDTVTRTLALIVVLLCSSVALFLRLDFIQ